MGPGARSRAWHGDASRTTTPSTPRPTIGRARCWRRSREERPHAGATDEQLEELLLDAVTLEDRYLDMLAKLADEGTNVVRFGVDSHAGLANAFDDVGMKIIGPSDDLLFLAAAAIQANRERDASALTDALAVDDAMTAVELFRRALDTLAALDDERDRPGHLVNLQSIVVAFDHDDRKVLFSGDMQLADPQTGSERMKSEIEALREVIAGDAPYDFVKIGHHGSPNAFDQGVLDDLGDTRAFGIIAGEGSKDHPHVDVLGVLDARRSSIRWARTDHQGAVSVSLGQRLRWTKARGEFNDEVPNTIDQPAGPGAEEVERPTVAEPILRTETMPATSDVVEVVARIPRGTRVRIDVEVDAGPGAARSIEGAAVRSAATSHALDGLAIGGGRELPALLWVTSPDQLATNIGVAEADTLLRAVRDAGHDVVELARGAAPLAAVERVRSRLRGSAPEGVVILGGHDVVPSLRVDSLSADLRDEVGAAGDPDNWIVWSDDSYGDRDGDSVPDVPVSRIPDARSAALVYTAVQAAPRAARSTHSGVRNHRRPFADGVFSDLTRTGELIRSAPHPAAPGARPTGLDGSLVYLMLHGDWKDASQFWGEDVADDAAAVSIGQIRDGTVDTVFTGCCWGGLVVDMPASRVGADDPVDQRSPARSIALRFLDAGARAFIGCTGAHYSPSRPPYDYFGGPLHRAFWRRFVAGEPPAAALRAAKLEYATGIPVRQTRLSGRAVEMKIWRQYTCLGLGW